MNHHPVIHDAFGRVVVLQRCSVHCSLAMVTTLYSVYFGVVAILLVQILWYNIVLRCILQRRFQIHILQHSCLVVCTFIDE